MKPQRPLVDSPTIIVLMLNRRRWIWVAIALTVIVVFLGIINRTLTENSTERVLLAKTLFLFSSGACTLLLLYTSKKVKDLSIRLSRAWLLLSFTLASNFIANCIWLAIELHWLTPSWSPAASTANLAVYLLLMAAVLLYPRKSIKPVAFIKNGLDAITIILTGVLVLIQFVGFPTQAISPINQPIDRFITMVIPLADILLLAAIAVLLYSHPVSFTRFPVLFIAAGILNFFIGDLVYAVQTIQGSYQIGGSADLLMLIIYSCFAWAALAQLFGIRRVHPYIPIKRTGFFYRNFVRHWESYLPFLWIFLSIGFISWSHGVAGGDQTRILSILVTGMIGIVIIRQIITLAENFELNWQLSQTMRQLHHQSNALSRSNRELEVQVAAHQEARMRLSYEATHDALTDLPNRTYLMQHLVRLIEEDQKASENQAALMFLDCDRFKMINDSMGHGAGDNLLIQVAKRIRACLRGNDIVARLSGDEFVIILPEANGTNGAARIAERILSTLAEPYLLDGQQVFISASIGIVPSISDYEYATDILRDADIAMYKAKEQGKACYTIFAPNLRDEALDRMNLERDLRQALDKNQFELFYQPVVRVADSSVCGFEALVRWNHPTRGRIQPVEFIPFAEQNGLIQAIDRWVMNQACMQFSAWLLSGLVTRNQYISVNISPQEFSHSTFAKEVQLALIENGMPARCLKLEITESIFLQNSQGAHFTFQRLAEMGVDCLLDDFGTGYSSLGYLQRYPIKTIKIDRSFINASLTGERMELARAIITVAQSLGLQTVAEGVETEAQLSELRGHECDQAQGFLFFHPQPREAVEQILRDQVAIL